MTIDKLFVKKNRYTMLCTIYWPHVCNIKSDFTTGQMDRISVGWPWHMPIEKKRLFAITEKLAGCYKHI